MGCLTKKPSTNLNFVSARRANDVNIADLGSDIGFCFSSLSAPTLFAAAVDLDSVALGWTAGTGGFEYDIYQSTDDISYAVIATVPGTSYQVDGLSLGQIYYWKIKYKGFGTESDFSNTVSMSPEINAPTNLVIDSITTLAINMSWVDNAVSVDSFRIERSSDNILFSEIGISLTANYADNSPILNSYNYYRVRAEKTGFFSEYSNVAAVNVPPLEAPTLEAFTAITVDEIGVNWTINGNQFEDGFKIERSDDGVGGWTEVGSVGKGVVFFLDTLLNDSTKYFYRVKAISTLYDDSPYSNVGSATTFNLEAPSAAFVDTEFYDSLKVNWTSNSGGSEDDFEIERSPDGVGSWVQAGIVGTGITEFTDTGLTQTTTYYYRVKATTAVGESDYSNIASGTTLTLAAPSGLGATEPTPYGVQLDWTSNSGGDEDGFEIEISTDNVVFNLFDSVNTNIITYTAATQVGVLLYYRVKAIRTSGDSDYSNVVSFTRLTSLVTSNDQQSGDFQLNDTN